MGFSTLNPYTINTNYAYGSYFFVFETLCDPSQDEAGVMYGLVAEAIRASPDLSSVSFRVNLRARFNNGDPVTAADVKYSFDTLVSDRANPGYAAALAVARRADVVDARIVRFEMAERSRAPTAWVASRPYEAAASCMSSTSLAAPPPAPSIPRCGRKHCLGQSQDRTGWHLPRTRVREIRASSYRPSSISVQPTIRPSFHPPTPGPSSLPSQAVPASRGACG